MRDPAPMTLDSRETQSRDSLHRMVRHLDGGGQITSGAQWIYRIKEGEYFLCCDTEGCCDSWMKTDEMLEYINLEPRDWREVPNTEVSASGVNNLKP